MFSTFRNTAIGAALALAASATTASATPIELTRAQFTAATAGIPTVVETFEEFAEGLHSSPLTLSNGTYTSTSPLVNANAPLLCGNPVGKCLLDSSDNTSGRLFSALPANTDFWSTDFRALLNGADLFQVTVVGASGTAVFTQTAGDFWGFADSAGLTSVTFLDLGSVNYSFDNVTTAAPTQTVSEPTSVALLGGLLGLVLVARRRDKATCSPPT